MKNNIDLTEKRRILKKVRRNFIAKTPRHDQNILVPVPAAITPENFNVIDPFFGITEKNRKIYFGIHYAQSNFNINSITIDDTVSTKTVTVNLQQKERNGLVQRESGIKRLESYGDLNLATWGWKIKNRHATYPIIMQKYFDLLHSGGPDTLANLRKARNQAVLMMKDIESKYIYKKTVHFMGRLSSRMLAIGYSERMIQEIGYNIQEFVDLIKGNGLPCIFKGDSSLYLDILRTALENNCFGKDLVRERPEYIVSITEKEGVKKEVVAQIITIVEPMAEGLFVTSYIVIKKVENSHSWEQLGEKSLKMKRLERRDDYNVIKTTNNDIKMKMSEKEGI